MAKQENILPKLPFDSEELFTVWSEWIAFRKENNWQSYKPIGFKNCIRELLELSENNEQKAIAIIKQSMAKGWRGLFQLKTPYTNERNSTTRKEEALRDIFSDYINK